LEWTNFEHVVNRSSKAISEMMRVAKPGGLILISDETEKHAKNTFERTPITRSYYKNRAETIAAPIDLVMLEMLDVKLVKVWENRFYVLTFRKPAQ
jgi:ubiquinone/menaquinone biosynthesis C-methylase UbiE